MKSSFFTFILTALFLASTFNTFAQTQRQNHLMSFSESVDSYSNLKTAKSHVLYDSTALDSYLVVKMNQYHFPGLQACIVKDDQIIGKGAFGYANIAQNKLVTDSTLFYLASLSKTVVATALMQLWEEGLFGLDDDINNYLPFSIRNPNHPNTPITFRMLLTHTSGINDNYWQVIAPLLVWGYDSPIALDSFLVNCLVPGGSYYYSSNYNSWTPGSQWNYSNVAATLNGYLVETISNYSLEQYCQDSIFIPLGMNETSWFQANLDISNIAMPYDYSGGSYQPYGHRGSPTYPAGQLRTSAIQLARYLTAYIQMGQINGVRILDSATVALMTTVQYPAIEPVQGLIWRIPEVYWPYVGTRLGCGHSGGSHGASTLMGYILETEENVGAIVLANGRHDDGIWEIAQELIAYGLLYNKIYAQNIELHSSFMQVNIDTLIVNTEFVNPNNHNFTSYAIITSIDSVYNDSIPLYDDGNHGDLQAGDGIWGNYILPISMENEFMVGVSTTDLVSGSHLVQNAQARFTTIGPVVLDKYRITSSDTIPQHTDRLKFEFSLRNNGSTATALNISSQIVALDTFSIITLVTPEYGNIQPGSTAVGNRRQYIKFDLGSEDSIDVKFKIDVSSNGYLFWSDTLSVFVHKDPSGIETKDDNLPKEFALKQNYPNPFNPSTTIEFSIPKSEYVTLKIYNILGQEVAMLVSEKLTTGNYKYTWEASGFASGVYYYKMVAGSFTQTRKLILMK